MESTSSVFISYRRQTAAGEARALFTDLVARLGPGAVFMDVDGILPGRDFRAELNKVMAACNLMLVIIDKDWIEAKDQDGRRRLENADDFVRMEIAAGLKRDIVITPVLVEGARMPQASELPEAIRSFAFRQGFELSYSRWESDVRELMRRLDLDSSGRGAAAATPPTPAVPVRPVDDAPRKDTAPAPARPAEPATTATATGSSGRKRVVIASAAAALALVAVAAGWFFLQPAPPPPRGPVVSAGPRITVYTQISSANDRGKFNTLRSALSGSRFNVQDVEVRNTPTPTNQIRYCNMANEPDAGALKTALETAGLGKFQVLKIERCAAEANRNILEIWLQG